MAEKCKDLAIFSTKPSHFSSLDLTPKMFGKGIGSKGASTLSSLLQGNTTLTSLDLPKNKLGDKGSLSLSICFTGNNTLQRLDLCSNGIKDAGCVSLFHALKANTSITFLDLSKNSIGQEGVLSIASWLPVSHLEHLNMAENKMGDSGCDVLLEGVSSNATITYLNLESNGIGDVGAGSISSVIKTNKTITSIYLLGNKFGPKGVTSLATAVQNNDYLTRFEFDTFNNAGTLREKVEEKCRKNARLKVSGGTTRKVINESPPTSTLPNRSNRSTISPETIGRSPIGPATSADELPSYAKHSSKKLVGETSSQQSSSSVISSKSLTAKNNRSTVDSTASSSPRSSIRKEAASVSSEDKAVFEVDDDDDDEEEPYTKHNEVGPQTELSSPPQIMASPPSHFYSSPSQVQLIPNPTIPPIDEQIMWDIQRGEQKLVFARGKLDQRKAEFTNANLMRHQEEFAINEIESQIARLNDEREQRMRSRDAVSGRIEGLKKEIQQSEQDAQNCVKDLEELRDKHNITGYVVPQHNARQITPSSSFSPPPNFSPSPSFSFATPYPFNYPNNPALAAFQAQQPPPQLIQQPPAQAPPTQQTSSPSLRTMTLMENGGTIKAQNPSPANTTSSPKNRPTKEDRPKKKTMSKGSSKGTINKPVNSALYYRATANYTAKDVGELSFVIGDQFVLEDEEDGWMNVVDQRGRFGRVPSIYTEVVYRAVSTLR